MMRDRYPAAYTLAWLVLACVHCWLLVLAGGYVLAAVLVALWTGLEVN